MGKSQERVADCDRRQDEHNSTKANTISGCSAEDCRRSTRTMGESQGGATEVRRLRDLSAPKHENARNPCESRAFGVAT